MPKTFLLLATGAALCAGCLDGSAALASTSGIAAAYEPLPLGAITARGWLKDQLRTGKAGMGGHLDELEPDLVAKPFVTRDYDITKGGCSRNVGWCSEISGEYWLGLVELAYTLDDAELKAKADRWVGQVLALQEADGYLGSFRATDNRLGEDFHPWGSRLAYRVLLEYYARTGDRKYLDAVHRGLLWFVRNWAGDKKTGYVGCTLIEQMVQVYLFTGDARLLGWCEDYAKWIDEHGGKNSFAKQTLELGFNHSGALATRAILPALLALGNGRADLLKASEDHVRDMDEEIGWQASYGPSTDREHVSYPSCVAESEYCDFVYYLENFLHLARITGKGDYADRAERIVFNAAQGARRKDDRAIAYQTSPNQFLATVTSSRWGWEKYFEAYAPNVNPACCPANSIRLWPEYVRQAVLKKGNDYYVQLFGPYHVKDGAFELDCETDYPFGYSMVVRTKNLKGSLVFRRPSWAKDMTVKEDGGVYRVGFTPELRVRAVVDRAFDRERLRTVEYGPLVFVQPLNEKWTPTGQPANCAPLPDDWTWWNVTCATRPEIYAMPVETAFRPGAIQVRRAAADAKDAGKLPWVSKPLRLMVPMIKAPAAYLDNPVKGPHNIMPSENPVHAGPASEIEMVEFVPYGSTCLRVTCFPLAEPKPPKPIVIPAPMTSKAMPGTFAVKGRPEDVDPDIDRIPIGQSKIPGLLASAMRVTKDPSLEPEGYTLDVTPTGILVRASTDTGAFWALQSLRQIAVRANWDSKELVVPCMSIKDWPKYSWRGLHLDDCRHFFGKKTAKKFLDLMALHKLNVFHWHLTDDQAWRLELKRHPELVQWGAARPESPMLGRHDQTDGLPYGPYYYTQDDVKEIIAYAAERHIEVVPEIEMPGHVRALLAAHPEFSCKGATLAPRTPRTSWGIEPEVLCAGNDAAIAFMKELLDEVCELFPGKVIHIGGDECPKERWKACAKCQARMRAEGLKDEAALEGWFANEMARHLEKKGRRAIGWDEVTEGGNLTRSAMVMNYFGPPKNAREAAAGHDVVANDSAKCYFDLPQFPRGADQFQYFWWGTSPAVDSVYSFNPAEGVEEKDLPRILGGQGNNWSEYTADAYTLEWKCWPRACALAETLWTNPGQPRDVDGFKRRLKTHVPRLRALGVNCAPVE